MTGLWIGWCVVTALLVSLIAYRSVIETKEDDQLFLDADNPTEARLQAEQQATVMRVTMLSLYIRVLWFTFAAILLVMAGIWIYRGVVAFTHSSMEP